MALQGEARGSGLSRLFDRTFLGAHKCRRERMSRPRKVLSSSAYMENIPRVQPERRPLFSLATPRGLGKRTTKLA